MSIEPENLSALADEIAFNNPEQLEIFCRLLGTLEDYDLWHPDIQFLADAFQSVADTLDRDDPEPCDLQDLRLALGRKYARRIGRE